MAKNPKINRVWDKQEKRLVRLLYRSDLIPVPIEELYWRSYKHFRKQGGKRKKYYMYNYLNEIHYCVLDYWSEMDEHGLCDIVSGHLITNGEINGKTANNRCKFIKYLRSLPVCRCDHKINKYLKIREE